ncbi:hypothetical protein [Zobellia roscoffensis]|uniref:hypothetical protein n=1 Tax=Zobellia roscoffensis TaxID=2779508 RepID=UPI00188DAAD2|nr:hypothetical protein [Zobellia roscoffensis]
MVKRIQLLSVLFILIMTSCSDSEEAVTLSSEKQITSFEISGLTTEIQGTNILIHVPPSADLSSSLSPRIEVSTKANFSLPFGTINLEEPEKITVTAEDGSSVEYTITPVFAKGIQEINVIYTQELDGETKTGKYVGKIDEENKTVIFEVSKEYLLQENVIVQIEIITIGEVVTEPKQSDFIDLSLESISTIIDETNTVYTVRFLNIGKTLGQFYLDMTGFKTGGSPSRQAPESDREGLPTGNLIYYTLENQDLSNISVSTSFFPMGATISPSIDESIDFTNDVTFTVTSESGATDEFTVRVVKKKIFFSGEILGNSSTIDNDAFNRYFSNSKISKLYLVNYDTNRRIACNINSDNFEPGVSTYITYQITDEVEDGERFVLEVELENGEVVTTNERVVINKK